MSLASFMVGQLRKLDTQWSNALKTLPHGELVRQRDELRGKVADGAPHPEAAVLALLEAELQRRHAGELPL